MDPSDMHKNSGYHFKLIPHSFDNHTWKIHQTYRLKVAYTHNPSKFWIITKINKLDRFHKYLQFFYRNYGRGFVIAKCNLRWYKYGVVYVYESYYRALLVTVPLEHEDKSVQAFLVDYGISVEVPPANVYVLSDELLDVPQFAIRATLSRMGPFNSPKWTSEATDIFRHMVKDMVLAGKVKRVDTVRRIVELELDDYYCRARCMSLVKNALLAKQCAIPLTGFEKESELKFREPPFFEIEAGVDQDTECVKSTLEKITLSYPEIPDMCPLSIKQIRML
ncbi:hypothetical protein GWI33_014589 [Rhynchophorus ferrugineus]|uniref:Tudor domain-containing protein n=1 Tax=Rhynchophorus ferrugineus TaxID=354439 RepID=A0A834I729_RHYFE|nr:hypothetical protein GWI33_014589 [Rhynchophorus ferrugineus]